MRSMLVRLVCCVSLVTCGALSAQCELEWESAGGSVGANARVACATRWDPDGAGPEPERIVFGGSFTLVGDRLANRIVAWNTGIGRWEVFGDGFDSHVYALTTLPGGDLIAAGDFTAAGGVPAQRIARWDGAAWWPLGAGTDLPVRSLATAPNGDLIAGGEFTVAGSVAASRVARWDGVVWSPLGAGVGGSVLALAVMPNGDVIAGGFVSQAGGQPVNRIARWDGVAWSPLGAGLGGLGLAGVSCLLPTPSGQLFVGGAFTTAGGISANGVARWDGSNWSALGQGSSGTTAMTLLPNGDLAAAATSFPGVVIGGVARWNGASWTSITNTWGPSPIYGLVSLPNGELWAGGDFQFMNSRHILRWSGSVWSSPGAGNSPDARCFAALPGGRMIVGGTFPILGGVSARGIASWDGVAWSPFGGGLGGVSCVAALTNGDIVADSTLQGHIRRWNGTTWSSFGTGCNGSVTTILAMPDGGMVIGGYFDVVDGVQASRIARWDGTSWSALDVGIGGAPNPHVSCAIRLPDGRLLVGGQFDSAGGVPAANLAVWDGAVWAPFGGGANAKVGCLALRPNGDLVVAGAFTMVGGTLAAGIARWDGSAWSSMAATVDATIRDVLCLPDGDVVAAGSFVSIDGVPARRVARWDGSGWSAFGAGLDSHAQALAMGSDGALWVGGSFQIAGDVVSVGIARLQSACPAEATPAGAGCSGSGGLNELRVDSLPWVDSTFRALGSGLPAPAILLALTSKMALTPPFALSNVFPEALLGCDLHVVPDIVQPIVSLSGTAQSELFLPDAPPLVGVTFHHQMVAFELGVAGDVVAITATNSLQLTAGRF